MIVTSSALSILSAMITPVVLILASGQLVLATSQRLSRVIDRAQKVTDRVQHIAKSEGGPESVKDDLCMLLDQIERTTRRARLLQRAMSCLYVALSIFVATSVSLGVLTYFDTRFAWLPILLGLSGTGLLFLASVLLIGESRLAMISVDVEMDYTMRLGRDHVSRLLGEGRTPCG